MEGERGQEERNLMKGHRDRRCVLKGGGKWRGRDGQKDRIVCLKEGWRLRFGQEPESAGNGL